MITCTRRIEFDAGHRIIGHGGKCKFLHGHRYVLEMTFSAEKLDQLGMVIDFGEVKSKMKHWIDNNLDHNLILSSKDKLLGEFVSNATGQSIYYMQTSPTVENIAFHLKTDIIPKLFDKNEFNIVKVKLFETPNCFVEV